MKALIKSVEFIKEYTSKFGIGYEFKICYDEKEASYSAKEKEQTFFVKGQEAEFTEEIKEYSGRKYLHIKPIKQAYSGGSNYGRAIKKEQSKYSGFAVSYVKDLIIADKIKIEQWESASKKIFNFMVELDKSIES